MNFFLDTNICIYFIKGKSKALFDSFKRQSPKSIKIPAIVKSELYYGAEKSECKKENHIKINQFLKTFEIIPFDHESAEHYGKIRVELEKKGEVVDNNDMMIAATALQHQATLVTHNTKKFKRVKKLKLEDWL